LEVNCPVLFSTFQLPDFLSANLKIFFQNRKNRCLKMIKQAEGRRQKAEGRRQKAEVK
jgi:hypothetical protein